jgi:hypothetical protein
MDRCFAAWCPGASEHGLLRDTARVFEDNPGAAAAGFFTCGHYTERASHGPDALAFGPLAADTNRKAILMERLRKSALRRYGALPRAPARLPLDLTMPAPRAACDNSLARDVHPYGSTGSAFSWKAFPEVTRRSLGEHLVEMSPPGTDCLPPI